jgi:hypothetical protein
MSAHCARRSKTQRLTTSNSNVVFKLYILLDIHFLLTDPAKSQFATSRIVKMSRQAGNFTFGGVSANGISGATARASVIQF